MRYLKMITILFIIIASAGCNESIDQKSDASFVFQDWNEPKPWTSKPFLNDADEFQFAIISDLYGDNRPGIFEKAVEKINLMHPEFVLSIGDLIDGYTDDEQVVDKQWKTFEKQVAPLAMRFFFVPGNHDLSNNMMKEKWEQRFGRTYYHFVYRNVLFLCLNSEDISRTIGNAQIDYVGKALDENKNVRWTMVFMHQPMWLSENTGWKKIEAMLAGRPHTVLAGHRHSYAKYVRNGQSYIMLATTGGGSKLTGYQYGSFDHITWVTMKDQGPLIANLDLDGILDEDIVTEEIAPWLVDPWYKIGEVVSEKRLFESGTTKIDFKNPLNLPLGVDLQFSKNKDVTVTPSSFNLTIPPKSSSTVDILVRSPDQRDVDDIESLELKITSVLRREGHPVLEQENTHYIHFRGKWQGSQMINNRRFDRGLQHWTISKAAPQTGSAEVISEQLVVEAADRGDHWNIGVWQDIGPLQANTNYRFSLRAGGVDSTDQIAVQFTSNDDKPIKIVIDDKTEDTHLIKVSQTMELFSFDFKIERQSGSPWAWLNIGCGSAKKLYIDDVSLRKIIDPSHN
jgi:predicted phosphodiesterase